MALEPRSVSVAEEKNPELVLMSRQLWVCLALTLPVLLHCRWVLGRVALRSVDARCRAAPAAKMPLLSPRLHATRTVRSR